MCGKIGDAMKINCFWEHNGADTLLHCTDVLGAFTRGATLDIAKSKMPNELRAFARWSGTRVIDGCEIVIAEEKISALDIRDADSDAIFDCETQPMTADEYLSLKNLTLKSAADFLALYRSVSDKNASREKERSTFYGKVPRTAEEMYVHTKNVNAYYFGEVGVECDNDGDILSARERGFDLLESGSDFLRNKVFDGSYGEKWSIKKVLRRFIWHDRIHAKAMYRAARCIFGTKGVSDVFLFDEHADK